jgi:DNA polymerase-3 subunit epsilon
MPPKQDWSTFESIVRQGNYVLLDTETTGLKKPAEIVQIAIIGGLTGAVLLDEYVKPVRPIPGVATAVHGITNDMVARARSWPEVRQTVLDLLNGKNVLTYNATYDRHMMYCSDEECGLPKFDYHAVCTWLDVMTWYSENYGEWNDYHGSWTWVGLQKAATRHGVVPDAAHTALADCRTTHRLLKALLP